MTLPEMANQSLCRMHGEPNVRLVFPVENWTVESSTAADRLILTLVTGDGFRASFALFTEELVEMANTALTGEEVTAADAASPMALPH